MAGDWLKIEATLPDKPEVFAITTSMGWDDPDLTVGKLLRVWRWFDQHTTDGNARGVSAALLDRVSGVSGFASAMNSVRWLTITDDGVSLPHFDWHNGKTAKDRAMTARRVAKHKAAGNDDEGNDCGNGDSVSSGVSQTLPREEKRREEEIPPKPPRGGESRNVVLKTWLEDIKERGEKAIPEDDSVFEYAQVIGLPREFLSLAWRVFKAKYTKPGVRKKYIDWRQVFRNAVEGNWLKLWYLNGEGYALSTVGLQAQKAYEERVPA